jgi:AcrR family transcriptional regulator
VTTAYPVAAKQLLRDTLLDAADALLDDRPWAKISMGEVARRAGVSRQTLYNEFGGRREFAEAFVLREAERLMAGPELQIAHHADDARAAIAGAMRTFLEAAARNRLLQSMVSEPDDGLLALVTTRDAVLTTAVERLAALIERTWPGVDRAAARRLTEIVVRLGISHATLPTATPEQTARDLAAVLGPHLDELVPSKSSQVA